jgi:TolA-binding protein
MIRRYLSSIVLGVGVMLCASFAAADITVGGVCIADATTKTLQACDNKGPASFNVGAHGKAPQVNFHSAPPPADLKKREMQKKPSMPTESQPRDLRKSRLQARAKGLLITEIAGLENLFRTTPRNAPDRVQLARRLAEDYVELESAAFRDKTQAEIQRDNLKRRNPQAAGRQQAIANQANHIMLAARRKVIDNYTLIINQYPSYGLLDEVLYYLAYEYEQANDLTNARRVYYDLIQKKPNSKYIPNAYLAFGELFFNEAQGDPSKWPYAAQAYTEVIKFPPNKSKVYGYAWYKLAYVFWNEGQIDKALNAFKKTIDFGTNYTQYPGAAKLADSARRDVIPVYALKGDPTAAYNFFRNISGDHAGSNAKTFKMLDDLGQNYLDTGHYPEAISLYRDLLARDHNGDKVCQYQTHITQATLAMKSGNKDAMRTELDNQLKRYKEFNAGQHAADAKFECSNKTAALVTETAMAWHLEAVGSQGQRGTGDPKTMTLAAYLYKRVVETWNAKEFSQFKFPRIVKADWPTIYKVKYAMADLLYFQQRWAECGPAFDAVVAENPQAPEAAEAAYASVLCFQNIYEAQHPKNSERKGSGNLPKLTKEEKEKAKVAAEEGKFKPKDLTFQQKGMVSAFNRYICYIHPAASDSAGQEQLVEVKFARARTYFEAQHWEEAASAFLDIAMNNSSHDAAIYAAQLYLESVNVLASHDTAVTSNPSGKRLGCFDDMATNVPKFIALYCTADKLKKNEEQCGILNHIQSDILRLKVEHLVEKLDKEGGSAEALRGYEQAGTQYLDLYRKYCETPIRNGHQPSADQKCDELVYNAAKSFQAGRLLAKAIAARMVLLNPMNHMDKSPLAKKAVYEIGGNYQAIAVYDQAADWYERYACVPDVHKNRPKPERGCSPKADKADDAVKDAVLLRLGTGDDAQAIVDADYYQRHYGGAKPKIAAQIAFSIGAHYADKEDWGQCEHALSGVMHLMGKAGIDVQVQAHATLARCEEHMRGRQNSAAGEFAKVRALWKDQAAAQKKLDAAYPDESQTERLRRLGKALDSVGEALFYDADEKKHSTVDTIKFPNYHGSGKKDDVLKFVKGKVADWMKKKAQAIVKIEADYKKIVDLQPEPPPRWVIAAGSRVGLLWGNFVDDFRRAPYPKDWDKKGCAVACGTADELSWRDIKLNYFNALDSASQPFKDGNATMDGKRVGAKPALVTCLDYSVKYQYFDDYSRACEVWLAKNYKSEYHVVDELRGAPTLSNSGLEDRPPPLLIGGTVWHPPPSALPAEKVAKADDDDKKHGKKK